MAEFKRDLEWVERLDVTLGPVPEVSGPQSTPQNKDQKAVDPEDDFQREMSLYVCFQVWELWVPVLEGGGCGGSSVPVLLGRCHKPESKKEGFLIFKRAKEIVRG